MNSTAEKQAQNTRATTHDPFASLRERGLIRDPISKKRHRDPPTIKAKGGSVMDLVREWR